jgi:dipeptidyl aminopeptidase/acylaminoacyl peptidase
MRIRVSAIAFAIVVACLLIPAMSPKLTAQTVEAGDRARTKRPMTFDDLMQMRRLGDTDVSPDGKWLIYSVTDVDLAANTRTPSLWIQPIVADGAATPKLLDGTQPGDSGAHFSHDGKRVLFLSAREGGQQIWAEDFDLATGAASNLKKLTSISTEADNALWAPDGRSIVFTSAVYPDCPAFSFADASQTSAAISNPDKCNADRDAAQAASKVKARVFDHLLYKHWNAFTGDKRSHLLLVSTYAPSQSFLRIRDLTPNDPRDVPPFSLGGGCGCAFSPDSKELAFTENLDEEPAISTNADIFTLDLGDAGAKPAKISTSPGGDFSPAYSPDGKYLAWRSQARAGYESDKFRLVLYDRAAKTIKDLLPNFKNWVDEFSWIDDSQHLLFVSGDQGGSPIYEVNVTGDDLKRAGKVSGEWSSVHLLPVGGFPFFLGTLMRVDRPSEVVLGNALEMDDTAVKVSALPKSINGSPRAKGEHELIIPLGKRASPSDSLGSDGVYRPMEVTHLNDALLAQLDLSPLESFWFPAADGVKVQGFLIKPPAFDPAKKYPVKLLIHGGPQGAWGDAWSYRWNAELLAANGYVVVMINPRGSTGYGQAFVDGVNGDWGGKPYTDLMRGLDYAEKTYPFIDKTRECALGGSYGGYMANWMLGHTDRFKCIVTHDGMFNPESAYGSTEELWFNEWEFKGKPWDYYGKPDGSGVPTDGSSSVGRENPFRKWSPALYAKNFKTPTLVIHSQLDYRLDVSEGYQLFTTLQRLKVPSKMLYFPDEGHWVLKPQNSQLWYKTVNAWVDEWTKPGGSK